MHQHSIDDRWIDNSSEIFFSLSVFFFVSQRKYFYHFSTSDLLLNIHILNKRKKEEKCAKIFLCFKHVSGKFQRWTSWNQEYKSRKCQFLHYIYTFYYWSIYKISFMTCLKIKSNNFISIYVVWYETILSRNVYVTFWMWNNLQFINLWNFKAF